MLNSDTKLYISSYSKTKQVKNSPKDEKLQSQLMGDSNSGKHNFLSSITCPESGEFGVCACLIHIYTPSKL
jgi:hypothetical protein